jgi:mono/diheme cytochrome c family protein
MASNRQPWKTDNRPYRRAQPKWPAATQVLSQLGLMMLAVGLWGALLAGFLWLTGETMVIEDKEAKARGSEEAEMRGNGTALEVEEAKEMAAITPTDTSIPLPTATPTATASPTPPAATPTRPKVTGAAPSVATKPPTATPLPTATPTEPPAPPTDEPARLENEAAPVSFKDDILPILERRCVKCHGGEDTEEGLKLKTHADIMAGSWNGPVVEPGDVENSFLVEQVVEGEMPKKGPKLLPAEIQAIIAWVEAGAPDN